MTLLTLTLCLASGGMAECKSHVRSYPGVVECREAGDLHLAYLRENDPSGLIIWAGWTCRPGVFG